MCLAAFTNNLDITYPRYPHCNFVLMDPVIIDPIGITKIAEQLKVSPEWAWAGSSNADAAKGLLLLRTVSGFHLDLARCPDGTPCHRVKPNGSCCLLRAADTVSCLSSSCSRAPRGNYASAQSALVNHIAESTTGRIILKQLDIARAFRWAWVGSNNADADKGLLLLRTGSPFIFFAF